MSDYSPFQPWSAASPYALALGLSAALCLLLALVGLRRKGLPGASYFALVMGAAAWWAFFYCWEIITPALAGKLFWLKIEYLGVMAIPLAWFLFARDYSGALKKLDRWLLVALCAMPIFGILLVVTNGMHVLMWSDAYLDASGRLPSVVLNPGVWYWVNTAYTYVMLAAGSYLLLRMAARHPKRYRGQAVLLVIAIAFPWIGSGLSLLVLRDEWMDVTPFAFLLTGITLLLAMTRWRLLSLHPVLVPLARMRALETMADPVLVLDVKGTAVTANQAALSLFGPQGEAPMEAAVSELLGGRSLDSAATDERSERRFEIDLGEEGDRRRFDVISSPLSLRGGGIGCLLVLRDITERGLADAAIRGSEERFRAVFEQGSVGIAVTDLKQRLIRVNPAFCAMLGYKESEIIGLNVTDITAPGGQGSTQQATDQLYSRGEPVIRLEKQYLRKDRTVFWGLASATVMRGGQGQAIGAVAMVQDISEQKRTEEALRLSQGQLEAAMDLADLVNWELDIPSGIFTFNDRLYALYGTTAEAEGGYQMPAEVYSRKFVHPEEASLVAEQVRMALETDDPDYRAYVEHRIVRADGEIRCIVVRYGITKDANGRTIKTHGANQDVTARKRTEEALTRAEDQLRQSQRMEAVGRLAGGIAHDFNNLLTAIIGNSDLALDGLAKDDPNRPFVEDIKEVADRAAVLTRQILAFSRRQLLKPEVVDLNEIVQLMGPLLRRTLGEEVRIDIVLAPGLRLVEVDPHQVEQVLMNLAVNARDAMPEGGGIAIETANAELGPDDDLSDVELEPGSYVTLAVSDTGQGMDEETRSRIFEPFFTTKELGKGTGLGLSTVFGIVRQSGGGVAVDSKVGKGSTFKVYLPASTNPRAKAPERSREQPIAGGAETILVVEDEVQVRHLVVRILARAGYTTLEASSLAEAEALLAARRPGPDLLLTDVALPGGGSGRDVALSARAYQPGIPVIFMSGYTQDATVVNGSAAGDTEFLAKPFAPQKLLEVVRASLDARSATV